MSNELCFKIKLAELDIEMSSRYENNRLFCSDYLSESDSADISVSVSESEIDEEMKLYPTPFSREYCENVCLYRSIAEKLPEFNRFVFHGAAVKVFDKGYIFTAPSGTGKSTHVGLLTKCFGDAVTIINGDKPILKVSDGSATLYSTPWAGKEGWQTNTPAPLCGIIVLKRGKENRIKKIDPSQYFDELIKQIYIPKNGDMMLKTLELVDKLSGNVDFYLLECDISSEAAETSYKIMSR